MGRLLGERLTERLGNHRHVGDIRGRGLFWAAEFVSDRATKASFDPALQLHERVKREAYDRGLACYPMGGTIDGRLGNHVILAPPYIVTAAQLDTIVDRFGDAVEAALSGLSGPESNLSAAPAFSPQRGNRAAVERETSRWTRTASRAWATRSRARSRRPPAR
jgi:hypothetical protein